MDFQTKTILVTGAPGWLGQALVRTILSGFPDQEKLRGGIAHAEIRCLVGPDVSSQDLDELSKRARCIRGDLRDPASLVPFLAGASGAMLFHAAGIIHPRRSIDFAEINAQGTENLLRLAADAKIRRAVVVSSNSPFGFNASPDGVFTEESPFHPYQGYGRSKMAMEKIVNRFGASGAFETVIVRPPWFYGTGQPPRQTLFFRMIRDGKAPLVGDGSNRRSMVYIDNLVQGLLLAAVAPEANRQTYWIADEKPSTMREIIETVERLLENEFSIPCRHRRLRLPGWVSPVASVIDGAIQSAGFYHQKMHVLSEMGRSIVCSVEKAKKELGYRPAIALEEGMRRSIRWVLDAYGSL